MSDVVRLTRQDVADSPRQGFWVHAGDFNQKIEQGLRREATLQQRLTAADERVDVLEGLLRDVKGVLAEFAGSSLIARKAYRDIDAALKTAEGGGDEE